jgi:hypothetical protein
VSSHGLLHLSQNLSYNDSSVFFGSTNGECAREKLQLDVLDNNKEKVTIKIPVGKLLL